MTQLRYITVTLWWARWHLRSPASRTFTQQFIQAQIKEAPRYWPLCEEFTGDRWIPAKRASNAENVSIWWRHHETPHIVRHRQTNIIDIPCVFTVVFNVLVVLSSDAVWPLLSWFDMCCIHNCSHCVWQDTRTLLCGNFDVSKCLFPNNAKRMRLEHCLDYTTSTVSKT